MAIAVEQTNRPSPAKQLEQLQQQYETVGVTPIIAASAAQVKLQQQTGGPVDEIDQEILVFADQTLAQQQALETLSEYRQSLEVSGFDQASAEYADVIVNIQDLTTSEAVEAHQVSLATDLKERGIEPHATEDIQAKADTRLTLRLQSAAAVVMGQSLDNASAALKEMDGPSGPDEGAPTLEAERELQMLNDAQILMDNAREAGLLAPDQTTLEGGHYRITQQGGVTVIEGDGKRLIADNGDILRSEGFGEEDYERFNRLGQRSSDELAMAVSQSQESPQQQERNQREHQRQIQRGQRMELT